MSSVYQEVYRISNMANFYSLEHTDIIQYALFKNILDIYIHIILNGEKITQFHKISHLQLFTLVFHYGFIS